MVRLSPVNKVPPFIVTTPGALPAVIDKELSKLILPLKIVKFLSKLYPGLKYKLDVSLTVRLEVDEPANAPLPDLKILAASSVVLAVIVVAALAISSVPAIVKSPPVGALFFTIKVCSALVKFTGELPLPSVATPQLPGRFRLTPAFE